MDAGTKVDRMWLQKKYLSVHVQLYSIIRVTETEGQPSHRVYGICTGNNEMINACIILLFSFVSVRMYNKH